MSKVNQSMLNAIEKAAKLMNTDSVEAVESFKNAVEKSKANREANGGLVNVKTNSWPDETMSTDNVGYGAEAVVGQVRTDEMYSMISQMPGLLPLLPSNHGQKQGDTVNVAIYGEAGLMNTADEPTGSQTLVDVTTDNAVATGNVAVKIKSFRTKVGITKKEMHDAIMGGQNFYSFVQNRILLAAQRTLEAYIINADDRLTKDVEATANVNFYDIPTTGTIPADAYYLGGDQGIRYNGIEDVDGIVGGNVAFTRGTLLSTMDRLSDYLDDYNNLLWIGNGKTATKIRGLAEYSTMEKFNDPTNTIGGQVMAPEGIRFYTAKHNPSFVGVSGKVEQGAGAANDFNQLSLIHKAAPQIVFGRDMEIVMHEDSQQIIFDVSMRAGCNVASREAGFGPSVATAVVQK